MLLIDGDRVLYTAAWAMNKEDKPAYYMLDNIMYSLFETYDDSMYRLFISSKDGSNFRYAAAKSKPYKGSRKDKPAPLYYWETREYIQERWGAEEVFGMEADDMLGIKLYERNKTKEDLSALLISDDKDLLQIPGWHGDFKGNKILVTDPGKLELVVQGRVHKKKVLKGTGIKWLYAQIITGDYCDEYSGAAKKGSVAAYKILNECRTERDMYNATLEAFKGDKELMDEMGTLAYILREEGDSWEKRKQYQNLK